MKLPPLKVLRVKEANKKELNPCMAAMSSVLGVCPFPTIDSLFRSSFLTNKTACWASAGFNTAGCAAVEASLRACMDTTVTQQKTPNNINYHLVRFQRRLEGRIKHKGSKD